MPISLPSGPTYQSGGWRLISNAQRHASPISRVSQSVGRPGNFWAATLTIPKISRPELAADWGAFAAQIAGGEESFYLFPPLVNLHTVAGSPVIDGADQVGQSIDLRGFTPGDTLRNGGFFCYQTSTFRMLHMVIGTQIADAEGKMTVNVRPGIRKSPADGAAVTVSYPTCEMQIPNADIDVLSLEEAVWYGHTFNVVEAVRG